MPRPFSPRKGVLREGDKDFFTHWGFQGEFKSQPAEVPSPYPAPFSIRPLRENKHRKETSGTQHHVSDVRGPRLGRTPRQGVPDLHGEARGHLGALCREPVLGSLG